MEEDDDVQLCCQKLEHEGGHYCCLLPAGHDGPHQVDPELTAAHEASGGARRGKRARTSTKHFSDELNEQEESKERAKPSLRVASKSAKKQKERAKSKETASKGWRREAQLQQADRPYGCMSAAQLEASRRHAGDELERIQSKLPPDLAGLGWEVLPKGPNGLRQSHFCYVFVGGDAADRSAPLDARMSPRPYFTSSVAAKLWWNRMHGTGPVAHADVIDADGSGESDDDGGDNSAVTSPEEADAEPPPAWKLAWLAPEQHVEVEMKDEVLCDDPHPRPTPRGLPLVPRGRPLVPRGRRYGSRYVAVVLEVRGGGKSALVEYNDFNDEDVPDLLLRECASTCQPIRPERPRVSPPAPSVHVSARGPECRRVSSGCRHVSPSPRGRWVPISRLRPIPPLTRPDFFDHLHGGERRAMITTRWPQMPDGTQMPDGQPMPARWPPDARWHPDAR